MSGPEAVERGGRRLGGLFRRSGAPAPLSRWAWTADVVLAGIVAGMAVDTAHRAGSGALVAHPGVFPTPPLPPAVGQLVVNTVPVDHWMLAVAALVGLPLVVRRFRPLSAFVAVLTATLVLHTGVHNSDAAMTTFVACVIAAYSAAMYSPYRLLSVWSVVVGALLIALEHGANVPSIKSGYVPLLVLVPLGLLANAMHTWKQRARAAEEDKHAAAVLAVEHERARIARELHDVVTHNVSVMVVQAGAARKVMESEPGAARAALLAVETGGRAAMTELRHVMGLLTMDGSSVEDVDLAPQPGLHEVRGLADRVRATGVPVEVAVTGTPVGLPPGVDLVAYRIVQEALTNALKHAAGAQVRIEIAYAPSSVAIDVIDSGGTESSAAEAGAGRGLVGMRERLAVYGGTLTAGRRPTGGYRVSAVIPVVAS